MRTPLAALALLATGASQAAGLADYRETLTLARDGDAAVTIAATLTDWRKATAERVHHGELSLLALILGLGVLVGGLAVKLREPPTARAIG